MLAYHSQKTLGIALVTLLGLALRLHHLDHDSLFMDEIRQVSYYKYPFLDIINLAASQTQPPLDYWIGKIFYSVSVTDFSVRLPAALFGTATVYLLTRISVEKFGLATGLILGTYLAINHYHIYYSQEARPYSLAIFLFVAALYMLDRIIAETGPSRRLYFTLFIVVLLFLHTRTLTPLLSVSLLAVFFLVASLISRNDIVACGKHRNIAIILSTAVGCYLPAFVNIYRANTRYLSSQSDLHTLIISGIQGMAPGKIWPVISTQSGNAGLLMLILAAGLPLLILRSHDRSKSLIWVSTFAYLCTLLMAHFFIHHARSPLPLRPPYAFYLLPLLILIAGAALQGVQSHIKQHGRTKLFIGFLVLAFLAPQAVSTYTFKQMNIKTDWRSLAALASTRFGENHLMLFETMAARDHWHPGPYGFIRYAHGSAQVADLDYLIHQDVSDSDLRPVMVFFHYRNYFLTPSANYGVMSLPEEDPIPITGKQLPSEVVAVNYPGLSIYYLSHYTGSLRNDSVTLLKALTRAMAHDSAAVKSRLALIMLEDKSYTSKFESIHNLKNASRPSQSGLVNMAIENLDRRK
jgi:hypothetical protein